MQASLFNNPMFSSGISQLLGQFVGDPARAAQAEYYASEAGLNNDTARYREAIGTAGGKKDLAGLLVSALQGGYGGAAPGIASSLASLPEYGFDRTTQGNIQVGTGTQNAQSTYSGLGDVLRNTLDLQGQKFAHEDAQQAAANDAFQSALAPLLSDRYVRRLGQVESGWKGDAQNPTSSAGGYFQWTDGTANQYGVKRGDLGSEVSALEKFTLDNAHTFTTLLGRPPQSEAELYLMHQQGAGGAAKLLANPNALAVDVVGRDAVIANGGSPDMTAGQFAQHVESYYNGGSGGGQPQAPTGQPPSILDDPRISALLMGSGNPALTPTQSKILSGLAETLMPKAPAAGDAFTLGPGQTRFDASGNPIASTEPKPGSAPDGLSAGGRTMLINALGDQVDPANAMNVVAMTEQLMQQQHMTENDAINYALSNLKLGPDVVDKGWFSSKTTPGQPIGINPPAGARADVGQPSDGAPRIQTKAEMDALPSGTVFIAPDGSRRVKP